MKYSGPLCSPMPRQSHPHCLNIISWVGLLGEHILASFSGLLVMHSIEHRNKIASSENAIRKVFDGSFVHCGNCKLVGRPTIRTLQRGNSVFRKTERTLILD